MNERAPVTSDIPAGTAPTSCKSCGAVIFWIKTAAGKSMPVTGAGISHFADCPNADAHRKPATSPVPEPEQNALRALINTHGERAALRKLGLSRMAAYRVLAGLDVLPGTRAILREAFRDKQPGSVE